ncbi:hypothetical protein DET50_12454 [Marinobacter pelagius]|uniref:Uncharacterized protein n=1 Tax=Marinobacter pelagius TaxID=379482 RepID=A0A366GE61_9GAMM|nr:hypothetical protein [Marinobacter pelagius]RBP25061.1 hypothetical protein DET50_12454 [Marinobacter pelagius]
MVAQESLSSPTEPINGKHLKQLALVLESVLGAGAVKDIDLAYLMNVPLSKLSELKKARSSIEQLRQSGASQSAESDDATLGEDVGDTYLRPHQAILTRLLLRHPQYAPLAMVAEPTDVFELINPYIPVPGSSESRKNGRQRKSGFAPLFGRSYVTSYKLLSQEAIASGGSLPVIRLQMLVVGKFAEIFVNLLLRYAAMRNELSRLDFSDLQCCGWKVLRDKDSHTSWMDDNLYSEFALELDTQWREWFEHNYLAVLRDEALSRDIDPEKAISRGNWTNRHEVTSAKLSEYGFRTQPILGSKDSLFAVFRESFELTSSEAYWALGLQIKAFYRYRGQPKQRIDAPTSILIRYLNRYPDDIGLFIPKPASGNEILQVIQSLEPTFRVGQLAPLFGASRVMSYDFAREDQACPFFARRLASIFRQQNARGEPIYDRLRECVEDELRARKIDSVRFWSDGRWHH